MAGGVEHDAQARGVAGRRLVLGLYRAALDGPGDAGGDVLDPDVEVHLHALRVRGAGPDGADVVLLPLDLDFRAPVGRTEAGPAVAGRLAGAGAGELFDVPAEELLVKAGQRRDVGGVEDGAGDFHLGPFHARPPSDTSSASEQCTKVRGGGGPVAGESKALVGRFLAALGMTVLDFRRFRM